MDKEKAKKVIKCYSDGPYLLRVFDDYSLEWSLDGDIYRADGPAVIEADGTKKWYNMDCQIHREDGPAIVHAIGTIEYRKNGVRHREDGPAIVHANGEMQWYLNGTEVSEEEFHRSQKSEVHTSKAVKEVMESVEKTKSYLSAEEKRELAGILKKYL